MALQLASLEKAQQQPGAAPVWGGSTLVIYDLLYRALRREREAAEPNQARIDYLTEQIEKLNRHVQSASDGPWPIHAIFTEPRTSKTMPLQLFVGPAHERDAGRAHTWVLVDLTYPAFYRTYRGSGETVREAIVACFEDARTSFRHTYPPGRILARIEFTGMERHGVAAGWDYSIETESWQRTAYEWLSLGASAIGAIGLAALIVFPPSAVLDGRDRRRRGRRRDRQRDQHRRARSTPTRSSGTWRRSSTSRRSPPRSRSARARSRAARRAGS